MKQLRLVLVTRRFWPLIGGAEVAIRNLARQLHQHGAQVTVLTAAWQKSWPATLDDAGVSVQRLPNPPQRLWGTYRYMAALSGWLKQHREDYDLVYVSMLKHDAYSALGAVDRCEVPVVLRPEGTGATGDVAWQQSARFGGRIARRCRTATALVAIAPAVRAELISAGYPAERIESISNGVEIPPPREASARASARAELAAASPLFRMPIGAPLALYTGRLHAGKGLADLVDAWQTVVARRRDARLWIVGEGPQRHGLDLQIRRLNLSNRVVLAGQYDAVGDFLAAADLFVLPSHEELMSISLLEAMAHALPIVASNIPGNRAAIDHERHGLLVPAADPPAAAASILRLFEHRELADQLATDAYRRAAEHFSLAKMADAHLELFARLT